MSETSRFKVFVDGVKVKSFGLKRGESKLVPPPPSMYMCIVSVPKYYLYLIASCRIVPGFPDKDGAHKEFLFSLPRFADDAVSTITIIADCVMDSNLVCVCVYVQDDRVERERNCKIGKIEVVRYEATFSHREIRAASSKQVDFTQANKKDVKEVTRNEYCMTTTRQGKLIRRETPYSRSRETDVWNTGAELDKLQIEYHMTQTLLDWGIQPIQPQWSRPGSSATPSTSSASSLKTE